MRKLILICYFIMFSNLIVSGQIEKPITKKNIYLGGAVYMRRINNYSDDNSKTFSSTYGFKPNIGYFVIDRLAVGLSPFISYSFASNQFNHIDSLYNQNFQYDFKTISIGLTPSIRYYFQNSIFLEANLEYSYNNRVRDDFVLSKINGLVFNLIDERTISKYNSLEYSFGFGYAYFINSKVSIDASLMYSKEIIRYDNKTDSNIDNSSVKSNSEDKITGLYFLIGLQVFL